MATAAARPPPVLHLIAPAPFDGLILVDVEGDLDASALSRWSQLLNGAITEGARGIAIDLRGCRAIDLSCLSVLVAGSSQLRARGDGGISLVIAPGSLVERRVRATRAKRLPAYSSAAEALLSLRDAQLAA